MLWFGKQAKASGGGGDGDAITPAELEVRFDKDIASSKLDALIELLGERGGIEVLLEAVGLKKELFQHLLPPEKTDSAFSRDGFNAVLETVFPARRKLGGVFAKLDDDGLRKAVFDLVYGEAPVADRMAAFCELVPNDKENRKARRAIWDLAAELLHFRDPDRIPLMTRWVWDVNTSTGALREFIRGNDSMETIPLEPRPEIFEGARVWFADFLGERGFYRDLPYLIDLLQAQAYSDYVKAMSSRIGMIDAEFGAKHDPLELVLKLLGIDARTRDLKEAESDQQPTLH
jgi:hypothetical protein